MKGDSLESQMSLPKALECSITEEEPPPESTEESQNFILSLRKPLKPDPIASFNNPI